MRTAFEKSILSANESRHGDMAQTLTDKLTATPEGMRLYQQERAILEFTELLCEILQEQNVTRSELARRLGKTKGYITQLLDGRANMTVRTMSDVLVALGRALHFQDAPLSATVQAAPLWPIREGLAWGATAAWPEQPLRIPAAEPVRKGMVA